MLKAFNQRRPKWADPAEFLNPQFQNLFELSYYGDGSTALPTGWQSVQDDTVFPRLSTRQAKLETADLDMRSPGQWPASEESGSEGQGPSNGDAQTRMADESSDEDSDVPPLRVSLTLRKSFPRARKD